MLDNAEHEFGFYEDTLDMAQVLDVNQQHYIQEVYLAVMPEDFGPEWTIAKSEVASLIHKCGILPGVRRIYIVMMWSKLGSITDDLQLKVQSATAFVRSIREMMPRVRQITLDSRQLPVTTGTDKLFNEELLQLLGTTVSEQTTFLELRGSIIPKAFNTPQPPPLLRELILEEVKATGEAVALVRQCAGTLEKLHMLRMPVFTVILSDAMSRIHHLELKMDKELYSALVDARVLARGAFTRLKFLSLNWSYDVVDPNLWSDSGDPLDNVHIGLREYLLETSSECVEYNSE
ncbi:hypothetical protein GGF46_002404 [Coemansia sp. RSA 552]|nr:hypothetical protein GGF46_002404 [Coemansia sp. RSA 552]